MPRFRIEHLAALLAGCGVLATGIWLATWMLAGPGRCQPAIGLIINICVAFGPALMLFAFLPTFTLNVTIQGITAGGAAAVLVLFFLVKPVVPAGHCDEPAPRKLFIHVYEGNLSESAPGAVVTVLPDSLPPQPCPVTDGTCTYSYDASRVGTLVKIYAAGPGYLPAPEFDRVLDTVDQRIDIPLVRSETKADGAVDPGEPSDAHSRSGDARSPVRTPPAPVLPTCDPVKVAAAVRGQRGSSWQGTQYRTSPRGITTWTNDDHHWFGGPSDLGLKPCVGKNIVEVLQ